MTENYGHRKVNIMPQNPASSDHTLSIRTSCNRCRAQKLKCIISDYSNGSIRCQRCIRARVLCVFGRRERKQRASSSESAPKAPPRQMPPVEDQDKATTARVQYPSNPDDGVAVPEALMVHEPGVFPPCNNHALSSSIDSEKRPVTTPPQDGMLNDVHGDKIALDDANLLDYDTLYPGHEQNLAFLTEQDLMSYGTSRDCLLESSDSISLTGPSANITPRAASIALLQVAANLHEKLDALENMSPWECEHGRMEKYPIGSILQLSKRLQSIGSFLRLEECSETSATSDKTHEIGSMQEMSMGYHLPQGTLIGDHELGYSNSKPPPRFDASISLMLQSCYVTLIQVCVAVLGHFQEYLRAQPSARTRLSSTFVSQSSVLYLGDLAPLDQSQNQIHTAMHMLLSSLEEVEEALCLPPHLRHACIVEGLPGTNRHSSNLSDTSCFYNVNLEPALMNWEFSSNSGGIREIVLGFGQKVKETKDMLRQQMDL